MKKILMMTLALTVCASGAMADHVGLYSDPAGVDCTLNTLAPAPGNNAVYIVHKFNAGATAVQFRTIDASGLFFASAVFPAAFLTLGTWNQDLSVAYGGCLIGDIAVGTLNFFWFGTPIAGCNNTLELAAAPTSPIPGEIAKVECDFETVTPMTGGKLWIGSGADECVGGSCDPLATQENTWGGIKALYR